MCYVNICFKIVFRINVGSGNVLGWDDFQCEDTDITRLCKRSCTRDVVVDEIEPQEPQPDEVPSSVEMPDNDELLLVYGAVSIAFLVTFLMLSIILKVKIKAFNKAKEDRLKLNGYL